MQKLAFTDKNIIPNIEAIKMDILPEDEVFLIKETGARFTIRESK